MTNMLPSVVTLAQAIDAICRLLDETPVVEGAACPAVFVVGAGISAPSVPLAHELIEQWKRELRESPAYEEPPDGVDRGDLYAHWLRRRFASPVQRQRYFRELAEGRPITQSNLRLARLLIGSEGKRLSSVVITPNFDELLTRSLWLLGHPPDAFDHPATMARFDPDAHDRIQVMHVHGVHRYYDIANSPDELAQRREASETQLSTPAILDPLLFNRTVIVIGYSGWNDVILQSLARRRRTGPKHAVYWFCYRRSDLPTLPDWLRDDETVYFVLPEEAAEIDSQRRRVSAPSRIERDRIPEFAVEGAALSEEFREQDEPTLPASRVLDELIRCLELDPPLLVEDPLRHFAEIVRSEFPTDENAESVPDIYRVHQLAARLEAAHARTPDDPAQDDEERAIASVVESMAASRYSDAIQRIHDIVPDDFGRDSLARLATLANGAGTGLDDNSLHEVLAYELAVDLADRALRAEDSGELTEAELLALDRKVARSLFNKAIVFRELDRWDDVVAAFDAVVERFGDASELELRELVGRSLVGKGVALRRLEHLDEAAETYGAVVDRFGDASELALLQVVARALVGKGIALRQLEHLDEAAETYDAVVERFGDASELALREQVALALIGKGMALGGLGREDEAAETFDAVVERFGDASELSLRRRVALALAAKGAMLGVLKHADEAAEAFDAVELRFGDASELALREVVAIALVGRGIELDGLGREDEAAEAFDAVELRFGDASELTLREEVARALVSKGAMLSKLDRPDEAIEAFDAVAERFGDASELALREQVAMALFNKAGIQAMADRLDLAFSTLTASIDAGFDSRESIESDPDLESLRTHPDWGAKVRNLLDQHFSGDG